MDPIERHLETVVVTGGAGYIGSAIVRRFAKEWYRVGIADINQEAGSALERGLANEGRNVHYFHVDVRDHASLKQFSDELAQVYGRLAHLVTVHGWALPEENPSKTGKDFHELDPQVIEDSIALNLTAHAQVIRHCLPLMLADPAADKSITTISSINGLRGLGMPAYGAAKSHEGLVKNLANVYGKDSIRVNSVAPGTVPSPRTVQMGHDFERLKDMTAMDRFATVEDLANTVYFLAAQQRAITGQVIVVDFGQTTKLYVPPRP